MTVQSLQNRWQYIQEDELVQSDLATKEQIYIKGAALARYTFGSTMRLNDTPSGMIPSFGILLHYEEKENLRIRFSQYRDCWALLVESEGVIPAINRILPLSVQFNPEDWNTLQVTQKDEHLQIVLNDVLLLSVLDGARIGQPGLTIQNAAVEINRIWQTPLD